MTAISRLMGQPFLVFVISLVVLSVSVWIGVSAAVWRRQRINDSARDDLAVVQAATLTLLGLIIGFSFSMAISRYDLRKTCEEAEANAIGTEYVRADLLPATNAPKVRTLLRRYTEQRIFYTTRDLQQLQRINADTSRLQVELWSAVEAPAKAEPTCMVALAVSGVNDVLNSEGYTQAAWWNRIPVSAWGMMGIIAIFGCLLTGYGARSGATVSVVGLVLPLVVSVSFLLIADIDSPRGGVIHVSPQNLRSVLESLPAQ